MQERLDCLSFLYVNHGPCKESVNGVQAAYKKSGATRRWQGKKKRDARSDWALQDAALVFTTLVRDCETARATPCPAFVQRQQYGTTMTMKRGYKRIQ